MTFLIPCPECGPREALEFSYGGESALRAGPDASGHELARYLFFRDNVNGWQTEWWVHQSGCRKWFLAERHTMTNAIRATYLPDRRPDPRPDDHPGDRPQVQGTAPA